MATGRNVVLRSSGRCNARLDVTSGRTYRSRGGYGYRYVHIAIRVLAAWIQNYSPFAHFPSVSKWPYSEWKVHMADLSSESAYVASESDEFGRTLYRSGRIEDFTLSDSMSTEYTAKLMLKILGGGHLVYLCEWLILSYFTKTIRASPPAMFSREAMQTLHRSTPTYYLPISLALNRRAPKRLVNEFNRL